MPMLDIGSLIIEKAIDKGSIPGACWALVTKAGPTFYGHAGMRRLVPDKMPVAEDTLYDMASCTKVVATTTMALQLIEQGRMSLKTRLSDILTDFPHPEVTIGHIMTHTSGICHDDKAYKAYKGERQIWDFFKDKPLEFAPGTNLVYSDFGYVALGLAIEKMVEAPLDVYAREHIFQPLAMNETGYRPADRGLASRCAATEVTADRGIICGEVHDGKAWRLDEISGNAGLFSTTHDLARFVRMMLNDGSLDGAHVLSPTTIGLLKRCYTEGLPSRRTLGWIVGDRTAAMGDYYSDHCLFHTGFSGTSIYIDFDRGCGVILLTNRIHPRRDNDAIMDLRNRFHNTVLLAWDQAQR